MEIPIPPQPTEPPGEIMSEDELEPVEADPVEADPVAEEAGEAVGAASTGTAATAALSDRDGQRLISTQTVQHDYLTLNGKVARETITTDGIVTTVMDFIYDESGRPFALNYSANGGSSFTTYYYILNLQGDVVKLVTSTGTSVAEYSYDAWGNILTATGTMAEINPLRYRGYYYDSETGFYYLQSRYYDPLNHRFINADAYTSTDATDAISCNMFAYCGNNPVMCSDYNGMWSLSSLFAGIAIAAAVVAAAALCVVTYGAATPVVATVAGTAISGATVAAAATTVAVSAAEVAACAAAASIVSNSVEKRYSQSYSVYFLADSDGNIQYVGRVTDKGYNARMAYHKRTRGLEPAYRISGLNYYEARGLEEIGMIECHTLNDSNPINNQIHGIGENNPLGATYMDAAVNYLVNRAEDSILNLLS